MWVCNHFPKSAQTLSDGGHTNFTNDNQEKLSAGPSLSEHTTATKEPTIATAPTDTVPEIKTLVSGAPWALGTQGRTGWHSASWQRLRGLCTYIQTDNKT